MCLIVCIVYYAVVCLLKALHSSLHKWHVLLWLLKLSRQETPTDTNAAIHCKSEVDISKCIFPTSDLNVSQIICLETHGFLQQTDACVASL